MFYTHFQQVKCDESKPTCDNCSRLKLDCVWTEHESVTVSGTGVLSPLAGSSRRTKACDQCRAVKAGCTTEKPACRRCTSLSKLCTYQGKAEVSASGMNEGNIGSSSGLIQRGVAESSQSKQLPSPQNALPDLSNIFVAKKTHSPVHLGGDFHLTTAPQASGKEAATHSDVAVPSPAVSLTLSDL